MEEARAIVELSAEYITYLAPALLIFSAVAAGDLIVEFAISLVRRTRKSYKV